MKKFKNRDRPQKIITAVAAVLVCILTVGFISATFSGSNGSPFTESGGIIEGSGSSSSDDVYLPTFEMVNSKTFDDSFTYTAGDDAVYRKGNVRLDKTVINFGSLSTKNGYLEYKPSESEPLREDHTYLMFFLHGNTCALNEKALLDMSKFDVMTLDFDLWSNGEYPDDLRFDFSPKAQQLGSNDFQNLSNFVSIHKNSISGKTEILPFTAMGNNYIDVDSLRYVLDDVKESIHCTYVIQTIGMGVAKYSFFVNGVRLYTYSFMSGTDLMSFIIRVPYTERDPSYSICIDNFQVCTYGNENLRYRGDLAGNISKLDLTQCSDWIYYGYYPISDAEGANNETTE